jgi:hypothetical protein
MTRLPLLGIVCATFFVVLSTRSLAAATETAEPYGAIDTAAATAAKASPELVGALSKELSATPEQAAGAAGALFGLAKSRLKADEFSQVAKAVPGMDLLLQAAPSAGDAASAAGTGGAGGVAGALSQLAGTVGGLPAVAAGFSKLGLKPEMAPKAVSTLVSFVTKSGGANVGSLLAGVLK